MLDRLYKKLRFVLLLIRGIRTRLAIAEQNIKALQSQEFGLSDRMRDQIRMMSNAYDPE